MLSHAGQHGRLADIRIATNSLRGKIILDGHPLPRAGEVPPGPWPEALSVGMGFVPVEKICILLIYIIHLPGDGASIFK